MFPSIVPSVTGLLRREEVRKIGKKKCRGGGVVAPSLGRAMPCYAMLLLTNIQYIIMGQSEMGKHIAHVTLHICAKRWFHGARVMW